MSDRPMRSRGGTAALTRPLNAMDLRVGNALLRLRAERGATVEEMAGALDIEPRLLRSIEAGRTRATAQLLMRISLRFDVPTSRFYE